MTPDNEPLFEWRVRLERAAAEVESVARPLSDQQLRWNPPDGGWSVAQVLDHLAQTNEQYVTLIRAALRDAPRTSGASRRWRPSFFGGLLAKMLVSPRKARAPRSMRPASEASPDPLGRFLASVRSLRAEMERAAGVDLRRTRTHSPASRLARLNLGDAFYVQALHVERHLGQIRRVLVSHG